MVVCHFEEGEEAVEEEVAADIEVEVDIIISLIRITKFNLVDGGLMSMFDFDEFEFKKC